MTATDDITRLNYTTHALEQLRSRAGVWSDSFPRSARALHQVCNLLQAGVKFLLPNCGLYVEPTDLFQADLDLLMPPYPITVLEAPWRPNPDDLARTGFPETLSTKRIVLCLETRNPQRPGSEKGVLVYPISWVDLQQQWIPMLGGVFIPYGIQLGQAPGAAAAGQPSILTTTAHVVLPELFEAQAQRLGAELALKQLVLNSMDEVRCLVQLCATLNCSNVSQVDRHPPVGLQKKRLARGRQPFYSYKVLELKGERLGDHRQSPTYASPRQHIRRRHMRTLPNGKRVIVRQHVVNPGSTAGVVQKDYRLPIKT